MVRRWSCVNSINISIDFINFSYFIKKRYKFINFKSSLSLKRFNKKYTKFKRKAFNRIKHLKNWNVYHNVFNTWARSYSFYKKVAKIQFLSHNMRNSFLFYNFIFLTNKVDLMREASFTFFNSIKNQYNHTSYLFKRSPHEDKLTNRGPCANFFFMHAELQINTEFPESARAHTFLLKDATGFLLQNRRQIALNERVLNKLFFKKIIFLKFKIITEHYRILYLIINLNIH